MDYRTRTDGRRPRGPQKGAQNPQGPHHQGYVSRTRRRMRVLARMEPGESYLRTEDFRSATDPATTILAGSRLLGGANGAR